MTYLKKTKDLIVTDGVAEDLKIKLATAMPRKDIQKISIVGRDINSGLNKTVEVSSEDIGRAIDDNINTIIATIHSALEQTPPELVSDIIERGIVIAGGGALIKNLPERIENEIRIPVRVAQDPLLAIARGGEKVLSDPELLEKIRLEV